MNPKVKTLLEKHGFDIEDFDHYAYGGIKKITNGFIIIKDTEGISLPKEINGEYCIWILDKEYCDTGEILTGMDLKIYLEHCHPVIS